ncbi:MAG: MFS transporter [Hyphomicrobiaceae bacterium]
MPQQPSTLRVLFAVPDYRRLWSIGAGVGLARWLEFLALAIYAFQLTGSAQLVALLAIARMVPYVAFGFLVGALADLFDRRRLLILSFLGGVVTSIVMTALALTGSAGYWSVVVAAMVSGAIWITDMPVRRRLLVEAAGAPRVASALGFDNSTSHATRALGPLAGGGIYQWLGLEGIFCLSALVYLGCLVLSVRLTPTLASDATPGQRISPLALIVPPKELIFNRPFLLMIGITIVYNVWCFPFMAMIPVIAQKDFALSPAAVGALSACDGIGGTLGAIAVGLLVTTRTLFHAYFLGTLAFLLLLLAMSLYLTVEMAVVCLLLIGVAAACFSATQYALVYALSSPEVRGRATGFLSIFIGTSIFGFYNTGYLFARFSSTEALKIMVLEGLVPLLLLGILWARSKP